MQLPLQITARDISLSEAIEADIREKVAKLELFYHKIMKCRVVLEAPAQHHRRGGPYRVRIDLTVPGTELVVNHQADEDLYVAVRNAFNAAQRQLKNYVRRQRGQVKTHEAIPHARVSKLFPQEGYGFLETPEGREIYFHHNSVLAPGFDHLEVGTEVRFTEEPGIKGPQASTVTIVGRHHL